MGGDQPATTAAPLMEAKDGLKSAAVKAMGAHLPLDSDFEYHYNFREFSEKVDGYKGRIATLLAAFQHQYNRKADAEGAMEDPEDAHEWVIDALDDSFERVDANLEALTVEQRRDPQAAAAEAAADHTIGNTAAPTAGTATWQAGGAGRGGAPGSGRPQDHFKDKVENANVPFRPKHKHLEALGLLASAPAKGGAKGGKDIPKGLQEHLSKMIVAGSPAAGGGRNANKILASYEHPLEDRIKNLEWVPEQLRPPAAATPPGRLEDTPLTLVDTPLALQQMAEKLARAPEVAIDLEGHSYRSFQGFVCLMQVSTRAEDWIVDTLALREHLAEHLAAVLADPKVVKVLHGSDGDVVWLQRDFGLYLVNMFDTGQAARVLDLPGKGLAHLLAHYCGVKADKRFQLADWRVRPLPQDMVKYAREDTHYLLYIYDRLREVLADMPDGSGIPEVLKRSSALCLRLYEKPLFRETDYLELHRRQGGGREMSNEQLAVMAGLHAWRDRVARREDESTGYVLPNGLLIKISEKIPSSLREANDLMRGSHSLAARRAKEVVEVVADARKQGAPPMPAPEPPAAIAAAAASPGRGAAPAAERPSPAAPAPAAPPPVAVAPAGGARAAARPAVRRAAGGGMAALLGGGGAGGSGRPGRAERPAEPTPPPPGSVKPVTVARRAGGSALAGLIAPSSSSPSAAMAAAPAGGGGGRGKSEEELRAAVDRIRGAFALPFSAGMPAASAPDPAPPPAPSAPPPEAAAHPEDRAEVEAKEAGVREWVSAAVREAEADGATVVLGAAASAGPGRTVAGMVAAEEDGEGEGAGAGAAEDDGGGKAPVGADGLPVPISERYGAGGGKRKKGPAVPTLLRPGAQGEGAGVGGGAEGAGEDGGGGGARGAKRSKGAKGAPALPPGLAPPPKGPVVPFDYGAAAAEADGRVPGAVPQPKQRKKSAAAYVMEGREDADGDSDEEVDHDVRDGYRPKKQKKQKKVLQKDARKAAKKGGGVVRRADRPEEAGPAGGDDDGGFGAPKGGGGGGKKKKERFQVGYDVDDTDMKGGKKRGVFTMSGNKSRTFSNKR